MKHEGVERLGWRSILFRDGEWQAYTRAAGAWYGLTVGLIYGLIVLGIHTVVFLRSRMVMPWGEIIVGFALCLAGWAVAGYLAGAARSAGWSVLICAVAGFVTPWFLWLAGLLNENWVWFLDQRGWEPVVHFGDALRMRLLFIGLWGVGIGAGLGLLERILLPRAWDESAPKARATWRSFAVLMICAPLVILLGAVTSDLLHRDLHETVSITSKALTAVQQEEKQAPFVTWRFNKKGIKTHVAPGWPTGDFRLELVDYDSETMGEFFVDAIYEDGTVARCLGGLTSANLCGDVTDTLEQLMANIVRRMFFGGLDSMACEECDPYVKPSVILALKNLSSHYTHNYEVFKRDQRGGAVTMVARFDTGYEITCHFHGENPVAVEFCRGNPSPAE